ncbi:alpha hydrolase [Haloplanus litoreus]|uniref:Alpha hydrolase n=1 Tax=Haloplanus litoreus TaxID=767515 RepID=A0ABD5ZU79_9EURY
MDVALLFSGGKDSALAALSLDRFYDVTLVTGTFGISSDWQHGRRAADRLGFPFRRLDLDPTVAADAVDRMLADGYPRNGIQMVHEHALERAAELDVTAVADGTRRDDRVPAIDRATARSLEDRHGVDYLAPLTGFGRGAIDRLVDATLDVQVGPSEDVPRADYEAELRDLLTDREGLETVGAIFPAHEQTVVRGRAPSE